MTVTKSAALFLLSATAAVSAAADTDKTLDLLHQAGARVESLAAEVELATTDRGTGRVSIDRGRFVMKRLEDGDTKARITFTERIIDERLKKSRREYLLMDGKLIEQNHDTRKQVTRQVRRPGEKVDLFKLGQGPFPLPIGQTRDSVHEQFEVTAGAGEHSVVLTPRQDTPLYPKFKSIAVTVDPANGLPTTIETADPRGVEKKTVTLKNVRLNDGVKDEEFILPPADPKEWNLVDE